jgi:hypothetical protein
MLRVSFSSRRYWRGRNAVQKFIAVESYRYAGAARVGYYTNHTAMEADFG